MHVERSAQCKVLETPRSYSTSSSFIARSSVTHANRGQSSLAVRLRRSRVASPETDVTSLRERE